MVTADPQRTPSFTLFGNPDYFLTAGRTSAGAPTKFNCPDSAHQAFVCIDYHFAWSHGDATEDIGRTWLGMAGPGVKHLGITSQVWSDHTDIQPTILSLLDLRDSYQTDGRVLNEFLENHGHPHGPDLTELGSIYKQINAPFGQLSFDVLAASTRALASGSATDDNAYNAISDRIAALTSDRDALAGQMRDVLNEAAFGGQQPTQQQVDDLAWQGRTMLMRAHELGAAGSP
jgi:hypothetical protein